MRFAMVQSGPRPIHSRLLLGALAGVGGTVAMTVAMRHLERRLAPQERYPMPPREIVQQVLPGEIAREVDQSSRQDLTMAAHFGYGAFTGALLALKPQTASPAAGAGYGLLVWAASYLGWIPAAGILDPATRHPLRRNILMAAVHLIWGAATAVILDELRRADQQLFMAGPTKDAPGRRHS